MLTKLEIINETRSFYEIDTSRRAVTYDIDGNVQCSYKLENGNRCAVGRCLKDDTPKELLGREDVFGLSLRINELYGATFNDYLQEQYRGHELLFWSDLQEFHDNDANWDLNGLSKQGQIEYSKLVEKYS